LSRISPSWREALVLRLPVRRTHLQRGRAPRRAGDVPVGVADRCSSALLGMAALMITASRRALATGVVMLVVGTLVRSQQRLRVARACVARHVRRVWLARSPATSCGRTARAFDGPPSCRLARRSSRFAVSFFGIST
jgi:hypothetical protein